MRPIEGLVFGLGVWAATATLLVAIHTVVVPRPERSRMVRALFVSTRVVFHALARRCGENDAAREAVLARYAPTTLMLLPLVWAGGVIYGFTLMFWALDVRPFRDALVLSGSSLTTLGFRDTEGVFRLSLSIVEALIGLGIVALLISFLPTMYGLFSRREAAVARLEILSGTPPTPEAMIIRAHGISGFDGLDDVWVEWSHWFIEVEESHQTYPALAFFRSQQPGRSWIVSAGAILDTAAITLSSVAVPWSPNAALLIRSGFVALRNVGAFFGINYDPDPNPDDPISVRQEEFDEVFETLRAAGVPMVDDKEQAWRDFAGWRVNYDTSLLGLAARVSAPPGKWITPPNGVARRRTLFRRRVSYR